MTEQYKILAQISRIYVNTDLSSLGKVHIKINKHKNYSQRNKKNYLNQFEIYTSVSKSGVVSKAVTKKNATLIAKKMYGRRFIIIIEPFGVISGIIYLKI